MAMLKFRVKDMIVISLCTALIALPYFLMMHTPTAILVQNALADRLNNFIGKNSDAEGKDSASGEGGSLAQEEGVTVLEEEVDRSSVIANETTLWDTVIMHKLRYAKLCVVNFRCHRRWGKDGEWCGSGSRSVWMGVSPDAANPAVIAIIGQGSETRVLGLREVIAAVTASTVTVVGMSMLIHDNFWIGEEFPGLVEILERTALPNKTLLLTALNAAWAQEDSMIDLFLGSFHAGEGISHYLDHLLIIALDQVSYDRCIQIHHHCFRLETEGVDFAAEKFFMSGDYLKMMWRRVEFLRIILELGYNLLFSDADIMWFRDPFPHLSKDADFQIACDHFNGNPTDIGNLPNGGFVYVRSNERTIPFYKYWYEARLKHPTQHDQDVFNFIKHTKQFKEFQLKLEFLETKYFGGFCEVSQDMATVCTMHANCCTGLERKIFDLKLTIADWAQYKSMTPQQKKEQRVFWQAPRECLHSW